MKHTTGMSTTVCQKRDREDQEQDQEEGRDSKVAKVTIATTNPTDVATTAGAIDDLPFSPSSLLMAEMTLKGLLEDAASESLEHGSVRNLSVDKTFWGGDRKTLVVDGLALGQHDALTPNMNMMLDIFEFYFCHDCVDKGKERVFKKLKSGELPSMPKLIEEYISTPKMISIQSGSEGEEAWSVRDIDAYYYFKAAIKELWDNPVNSNFPGTQVPRIPVEVKYEINALFSAPEVQKFVKQRFDPKNEDAIGSSYAIIVMTEFYCLVFRPDMYVDADWMTTSGVNVWKYLPLVRDSRVYDLLHANDFHDCDTIEGVDTGDCELTTLNDVEADDHDAPFAKLDKKRLELFEKYFGLYYKSTKDRLPSFDYLIQEFSKNLSLDDGDDCEIDEDEDEEEVAKLPKPKSTSRVIVSDDDSDDSDWSEFVETGDEEDEDSNEDSDEERGEDENEEDSSEDE
jgi:hypothetical protein